MIYNRIDNANQYYSLGENIKKGFEFLLNSNLSDLKDGKYEIEGDKIYANVQTLTTKPLEMAKSEAHRKYIDIQYLIKGEEKIGYGLLDDFNEILEEYDPQKDVIFFKDFCSNFINLSMGDFVLFYPEDVHAPMLSVKENKEIKKVIVKIAI
ncbi:YhcH/YjgK/YiaL family protein [bacterium]|nr:YhcH/YjgK/YiaL family protein [bacterium]